MVFPPCRFLCVLLVLNAALCVVCFAGIFSVLVWILHHHHFLSSIFISHLHQFVLNAATKYCLQKVFLQLLCGHAVWPVLCKMMQHVNTQHRYYHTSACGLWLSWGPSGMIMGKPAKYYKTGLEMAVGRIAVVNWDSRASRTGRLWPEWHLVFKIVLVQF